ncbi:MAG: M48 family metalloprotease [Sneathiella sp.]
MFRYVVILLGLLLLSSCVTRMSAVTNGKSYLGPVISSGEGDYEKELVEKATLYEENRFSEDERVKLLSEVYQALVAAGEEICSAVNAYQHGCGWFVFRLSETEEVNAYPWGVSGLTVNRRILPYIMNKDEMAYMLAHQIGHILTGHVDANGPARLGPTTPLGSILSTAFCGISCLGRDLYGFGKRQRLEAHSEGWKTQFTETQEREADYIAVYLMEEAGYNVMKGRKFLLNLSALSKKSLKDNNDQVKYLTIHSFKPVHLTHIKAAQKETEAKKQSGEPLLPNVSTDRKSN